MTKLVGFSDTHGQVVTKDKLPDGDVLCFAGDYSYIRKNAPYETRMKELEDTYEWFYNLSKYYDQIIFVPGNHDFIFETNTREAIACMEQVDNLKVLIDDSMLFDGITFFGSPWTPWFHDWAFNAERGPKCKEHWDKIPFDTNVIITHGPSYMRRDECEYGERYVGCEELNRRMRMLSELKVHFFGHIHESYGIMFDEGVIHANVSMMNLQYVPTNRALEIEI